MKPGGAGLGPPSTSRDPWGGGSIILKVDMAALPIPQPGCVPFTSLPAQHLEMEPKSLAMTCASRSQGGSPEWEKRACLARHLRPGLSGLGWGTMGIFPAKERELQAQILTGLLS